MVQEKGYFILPSELFVNVRYKAMSDANLNETLERVFRHIEASAKGSEAEDKFTGLFADFDVNSKKLGSTTAKRNDRLCKLLDGVADMDLESVDEHNIDALGDAYEYLMAMYASNAGKSGGEFFTPYSIKWAGDDNPLLINDPRYSAAGVLAPKRKADFAFILHSLAWLAENGTVVIICFPGIMYLGGAEQKIRQYLVNNNYVDSVIQLPDNLFFGAGIATCLLVIKKNRTDSSILFIDATNEYIKSTNNNRLTAENINKIVEAFTKREDVEGFCRLVSVEAVAREGYNLSVSTYVEQSDARERVDIRELKREIDAIVAEIEGAA